MQVQGRTGLQLAQSLSRSVPSLSHLSSSLLIPVLPLTSGLETALELDQSLLGRRPGSGHQTCSDWCDNFTAGQNPGLVVVVFNQFIRFKKMIEIIHEYITLVSPTLPFTEYVAVHRSHPVPLPYAPPPCWVLRGDQCDAYPKLFISLDRHKYR